MTVITTNLLSMGAQANLKRANSSLATAMERLSSGMRVNAAKDDAAGQAIGNRMTSQISGRAMAQRNANDGVSMAQTAHGALDQINAKLHRIRELTVQGLNGTLQLRDNDAIQAEINHNLREINRLADSVDYNGIPLLNGKAGQVDLQVGANDREMLGLDFRPPGFSVEALGLTDFTVAGIEGDVSDRKTLEGHARDIDLFDSRTAITMSLNGVTYTSHGLDETGRLLMKNGPFGRYVSDTSGDYPEFYHVPSYPDAHHVTDTDTSTVEITGQRIYSAVSSLSGQSATNVLFVDSDQAPFEEGSQRLIRHDGEYLLEDVRADGVVSYYNADLAFTDGSSALTVTQGAALEPSGFYEDVFDLQHGTEYYVLDDYNDVTYQLGGGRVTGTLVTAGGHYYLRTSDGEGGEVFRPMSSVEVVDEEDEQHLEITFSDSKAYTGPNLTTALPVSYIPSANLPDNENIEFSPAEGSDFTGNEFRLVRRNAVAGQSASWMIEEKVSNTDYRYHAAVLDVTLDSDGQVSSLSATAQGSSPELFELSEENRVNLVNGTSTVLIDPDNKTVIVNYTDANGVQHPNVLRRDGSGTYYFDLPESSSNYGNFKLASLVNHDGEDVLIKTVNGNSEVIVYHRTNATSGTNPWLVVGTDVNGPDDDGVPLTVINITESDYEIRLKTPRNPLAALDRAISYVDSKRSHLGAMENRLASVIEGHQATNINLSASRSRILEADYAVEVANMTKAQIMQQAGTSVLAQANQIPQNVLSLLG